MPARDEKFQFEKFHEMKNLKNFMKNFKGHEKFEIFKYMLVNAFLGIRVLITCFVGRMRTVLQDIHQF